MNNYRFYTKQLLLFLLIISVILMPFTVVGDASEKVSGLQFTAHPDGTFSVISQSTPLKALLSKIGETTNVDIYVDSASQKRPVSINVKNITLTQLLRRIAGDNYAMVYDGNTVTSLHVKDTTQSTKNAVTVSEFSGQVKITNQRARMFFMPADNSNPTFAI